MNTAIIKPLGKITAILADLGLEVTYAYDDLVFVQECAFLLQFVDETSNLKIFTNTECNPIEANLAEKQIIEAHAKAGFSIVPSGQYTLTGNDDETIDIQFV
ncbi:hypothetical protein P4B35_06860 [Pontiellaceae bacterium B12227]|nr:hypothetical protein [Pontiellaceae bacterium B12227]